MKKAIVYLDSNNIFKIHKKIDFTKLLEYLKKNFDITRATVYTSLDYKSDTARNFIVYLSANGWKCRYEDINQNTNIDSIITVDMINDSTNMEYTDVILISNDGDFKYPLELLSYKGKTINVIGCKNSTSIQLQAISDNLIFIEDIKQVVKEI